MLPCLREAVRQMGLWSQDSVASWLMKWGTILDCIIPFRAGALITTALRTEIVCAILRPIIPCGHLHVPARRIHVLPTHYPVTLMDFSLSMCLIRSPILWIIAMQRVRTNLPRGRQTE